MRMTKWSVDDCLEYMNNKYGEEFTFVEENPQRQATYRSLEILVKTDSYPGKKILVVEETGSDYKKFHDNYVAVKYEQQTADLLNDIASQVYGECRVIYTVYNNFLPDSFDGTTTFSEYISERYSRITFKLLIPPEHGIDNKEKELEQLYNKFCDNKLIGSVEIFYTNDREKYQGISTPSETQLKIDWFDANGILVMDKEFGIERMDWRKENGRF